jgi:hypothetical protein
MKFVIAAALLATASLLCAAMVWSDRPIWGLQLGALVAIGWGFFLAVALR